jgi:hypothetical protein
MRRRQLLQASGALLGSAILPGWLERAAADEGESNQPLWLHVQAGGGWDPTMLCDPRPEVSNLAFNVSSVTSAKGHTFAYADLGSGTSFNNDAGYSLGTFFQNQKDQLLVINGIFTATAGHATGACLAASGRLQPGHPSLFAMIAKKGGEGMTMPFIASGGGYTHTAGLVAPTWISDTQYLEQLAFTNSHPNGNETFYFEAEKDLLRAAQTARLDRLIDGEQRPHIRKSLEDLRSARVGSSTLADYKTMFDEGAAITVPATDNKTKVAVSIFKQGFKALVGYRSGLTAAAVIQGGSFDTHGNHDVFQPQNLQGLVWGLDLLMQEAVARGVPMVILVTSEFGRTATYNVDEGKDHWPVTSWMMLQTPGLELFNGGRLVGQSQYDAVAQQIGYKKIDPLTLAISESGIPITPDGLHVALRQLSGVNTLPESTQQFPLVGPDLSAVFQG